MSEEFIRGYIAGFEAADDGTVRRLKTDLRLAAINHLNNPDWALEEALLREDEHDEIEMNRGKRITWLKHNAGKA